MTFAASGSISDPPDAVLPLSGVRTLQVAVHEQRETPCCYKCGSESHLAWDCTAPPHCSFCADNGKSAAPHLEEGISSPLTDGEQHTWRVFLLPHPLSVQQRSFRKQGASGDVRPAKTGFRSLSPLPRRKDKNAGTGQETVGNPPVPAASVEPIDAEPDPIPKRKSLSGRPSVSGNKEEGILPSAKKRGRGGRRNRSETSVLEVRGR